MKFSVVIPTYNRADDLRDTLRSMAGLSTQAKWEVIVVDNNSNDTTQTVVEEASKSFPTDLLYVFEKEQGRCAALNAGIRASRGEIIVTTDDDVRVESHWLDCADLSLKRLDCDYVGGRVLPIWGGPRPSWLPNRGGKHWAVIALLDYGSEPVELGRHAPLGVNMAFRREAFLRAGMWDNRIGRRAGTLLGQEVREWCLRAKAAGLRGFYAPEMSIRHIVPRERLSKSYFRRWFYWHGVSRALLYRQARVDMESPEETALDFSKVPHIAGVPRYMFRTFFRSFEDFLIAAVKREPVALFESELRLWFFYGVFGQRWRDRKAQPSGELEPAV